MKNILIKQHDIADCGAACLTSVAAHYGLKMPISRVRQYTSTDRKGTNLLGLVEAAIKMGFTAKGVKGQADSLPKIPKPAIAHVIVKEVLHHFVVIYKADNKQISYMDPGDGRMHTVPMEEFVNMWSGALLLLVPNEQFKPGDNKTSILKRFISLVMPHKTIMAQALFGAVMYSLLGLSTSFYVQKIVDYVLVDGNLNLLNLMSIAMLAFILLRFFINIMKSILALKTGQKIDAALILGYYKHLMTLPQRFFDTMRVGEIISRVNDAVKIRYFINTTTMEIFVNLLISIFTLGIMFLFSWKLALIITIAIPCYILLYLLFNALNKKYLRKIMENAADVESQLVESLNSLATIKRFGAEGYSNVKTEVRFVKLLRSTFSSVKTSIFSTGLTELIAGIFTVAILWYGSIKVVSQDITPGTLLSFYSLIGYILPSISGLINANKSIQDALIAADRLFQIMDLEREETGTTKIELNPNMVSDIVFKNISFRYGSRKQVFDDFSITIRKGSITAIVGESGSGKTTLMSLLQNIYPLQSGSIHIGNYPINHISNSSLRSIVSTVPQHIDLLTGSVVENIAFGDFEPDFRRVVDICTEIGIKETIEALPNGFLTILGEHGANLSGGERQKVAIARALYKNPEIIIFDEATSALDSNSEMNIKTLFGKLKEKNKTVVIITHRLSSIINADTIAVIEDGILVETGNHKELLNKRGKYYQFWNEQFAFNTTDS